MFYSIVQGADWHYGPTKPHKHDSTTPKNYIKYTSLVTAIIALIFFVLYLVYQVSLQFTIPGVFFNVCIKEWSINVLLACDMFLGTQVYDNVNAQRKAEKRSEAKRKEE